ncbi:isochorismatase family protein [Actinacidiphila oryziradicis]|uniref:Isochorismatase family protein n=1 Tax=Actinacidiphila oryziradicis TaxID=2571141 RepID=A0A4V5MY62_9ACTN|nr:isochorismatase family protein [Actinacidiphila oryziradicis]TKA02929.1 isochorismatase family protein [Actinacidiphila oryziradicis]
MPVTTIDPRPALVVVDLQKGILGFPTAHPSDEILARAADLAKAFRGKGHPVVLVNVAGVAPGRTDVGPRSRGQFPPGFTDIAEELAPHEDDLRITKHRWGAFHGTGLDSRLRDLGVTQVVVCGIATSMGVESTARAAHEHGYHVLLAADAMSDKDLDAHEHCVGKIFPRLGEVADSAQIVAMVNGEGRD